MASAEPNNPPAPPADAPPPPAPPIAPPPAPPLLAPPAPIEPPSPAALAATARALVVGLAWGAVMLLIFGFWMRSKYEGRAPISTYSFMIGGAVAAVLAVWQAFALWFKKETPEQKAAYLLQQRQIISYALLAGGIGLILLAFVLGFDKRGASADYSFVKDNFAETFGAVLLGLIALWSGYLLQQPEGAITAPIQLLLDKVPLLKMCMVVIGGGSLIGFGYLIYSHRTDFMSYFPELAALLFMSILCLACVLWLNTGQFDEFGIRLFVLVFGGAAGVILFFMILCRSWLWRQDIFLGGIAAWQGENAWRFWLCAYVMFVALVLMFVSFNLARADIRKNVTLRRVMYGYDALAQALLLIGILIILNIVIYALFPFTYEWTRSRGAYDLADSNKNLVAGLKQDLHIFVLMPQTSPAYKDTRLLLDNCQVLSNHVKLEYISPDVDDTRYLNLAQLFPKIALPEGQVGASGLGRGILIVYGPMPKKGEPDTSLNAFIGEKKLFDEDPMAAMRRERPKKSYKGEQEILREVKFLVQGRDRRKLYFLQGNGELDINNQEMTDRTDPRQDFSQVGVGWLIEKLKKDNFEVFGLSFGPEVPEAPGQQVKIEYARADAKDKRKEVPPDCHTLIIAGASNDLSKDALAAIESYMERGGKMLVFLDVFVDAKFNRMKQINLENTLRQRFGVDVTDDVVLRFTQRPQEDPTTLLATTPPVDHPLARNFLRQRITMKRWARLVEPAKEPGPYKAEVILQQAFHPQLSDRYSVVQRNVAILADPAAFMNDLRENEAKFKMMVQPKSVPLAVTVSQGDTPRMVVFGDTDFITNREILFAQYAKTNYDFVASSIDWMSQRETIGGRPKEQELFVLKSEVDLWRMIMLPGWLMLMTLIGLGVGFWVVRRR
jgi:hypothetical protein